METILEIYKIDKLPEGKFSLYFKLIENYHQEQPFLLGRLKCAKYEKGYFHGGWNNIELVTYKDKIVIPQKIKQYIVKWHKIISFIQG